MGSCAVEIRRCQHIKTSGVQCGSPALKEKEFCYYHQQNRTLSAQIYLEGERYADDMIKIPPLEDAHSIQMVLRHIVMLMLERRMERKDAGPALYALQIASGNLKQMEAEKPRATQVVREPEKVAETPMGMTQWSATGEGRDVEDEELAKKEPTPAPPPTADEIYEAMTGAGRMDMRHKYEKEGQISRKEMDEFTMKGGPDPLLTAMRRQFAIRECTSH